MQTAGCARVTSGVKTHRRGIATSREHQWAWWVPPHEPPGRPQRPPLAPQHAPQHGMDGRDWGGDDQQQVVGSCKRCTGTTDQRRQRDGICQVFVGSRMHGTTLYDMVRHCMTWYDKVWHGMTLYKPTEHPLRSVVRECCSCPGCDVHERHAGMGECGGRFSMQLEACAHKLQVRVLLTTSQNKPAGLPENQIMVAWTCCSKRRKASCSASDSACLWHMSGGRVLAPLASYRWVPSTTARAAPVRWSNATRAHDRLAGRPPCHSSSVQVVSACWPCCGARMQGCVRDGCRARRARAGSVHGASMRRDHGGRWVKVGAPHMQQGGLGMVHDMKNKWLRRQTLHLVDVVRARGVRW